MSITTRQEMLLIIGTKMYKAGHSAAAVKKHLRRLIKKPREELVKEFSKFFVYDNRGTE